MLKLNTIILLLYQVVTITFMLLPFHKYHCTDVDNLRDVTSIADTVFTITGDCSTILHWEDYGFRMTIKVNSLPANKSCDIAVKALLGGQFKLPDGYILVSAVYAISLTRKLLKPAILEIQHCVDIQDEQHSKSLQFVTASCSQKMLPYEFTVDPSGHFYPGSQYATVYRQTFSMVGAAYKPELPVDGTGMYMYTYTLFSLESPDSARYPDMLCQARTLYHRNRNRWIMEFIVAHHLNALQKVWYESVACIFTYRS